MQLFQRYSLLYPTLLCCILGKASSWSSGMNPTVATKVVERPTTDNDAVTLDPATALQEYLDEAGALRLCDIGTTKYGRGLVARRDMKPGETVIRIPLSETILVEHFDTDKTPAVSDVWAGKLAQKLVERQNQAASDKIPYAYSDALPPPPPTPARGDWSLEALKALDDCDMLREINEAKDWRKKQWEIHGISDGALGDEQRFLDAIDLVSSRTIRCGSKFMLVPFLDMANYASRDQGGGYYKLVKGENDRDEMIELKIGDRGVKAGGEVFLDYGDRKNEEWLIHYGFLPDRNTAESIVLPASQRVISWDDVNTFDDSLKEECQTMLDQFSLTLGEDIETLNRIEMEENNYDIMMALALKYRIARKTLLSAVAGAKTSSAFSSAFL